MSEDESLLNNLSKNLGLRKYSSSSILLGLILVLGLVLRVYNLGEKDYWNDEMYTVIESELSPQQLLFSGRLDQPPAYYLPFNFWVDVFGTSEESTRSFSTLVGVGSIFVVFAVGRELFGKDVGLLSAFIMAVSELQIIYSQTARFYNLFEFFALLSFLFFIIAIQKKKVIHFLLYWFVSVLLVYSNLFGVFIFLAQNLYFLLYIRKYKDILVTWYTSQALLILVMMPYFYPLIFNEGGMTGAVKLNIGSIQAPSLLHPFYTIYRFILPYRPDHGQVILLTSFVIAGILLVIGAWYALQKGPKAIVRDWLSNLREIRGRQEKLFFLILWLSFPILLPFFYSLVVSPIYKYYYAISAAPAFYLLLALGMYSARKFFPLFLSILVLLIMIVPSLGYYYQADFTEQWSEAAAFMEQYSASEDIVILAPNGIYGFEYGIQKSLFDWYSHEELESCSLAGELVSANALSKALNDCVSGHTRIWVLIPEDGTEAAQRYTNYFLSQSESQRKLLREEHLVKLSVYLFE